MTTPFGSYIQGLPAASSISLTDQVYVLQAGGISRTALVHQVTTNSIAITNDISITNNNSLANLAGLSLTVNAGETYVIQAVLFIKSGAHTGGVQAAFGGTATATDIRYDGWCPDSKQVQGYVQVSVLGSAVASAITASDSTTVYMTGCITVNAGGTLTVQGAQNTSSGTATIFARGSWFSVKHTYP